VTDTSNRGSAPILGALRQELHADADLGPARLELERRRLVATIASGPHASRGARAAAAIAAVAAAAIAAAAAIYLVVAGETAPAPPPRRAALAGLVDVGATELLAAGRAARVASSDGAKIALADGTAVWLAADTSVSAADPGAHRLRLDAGRALAHVAPQRGVRRFVVETPHGDIEVRGTVFAARVAESGLVIDLYEGAIRFSRGGVTVDVDPGESLRVRADGAIASRSPIDRAAVLADLLITEKTAQLPGAPVPRLAPVEPEEVTAPAHAPPAPPPPAAAPGPPPPKRPLGKPPAEAPATAPAPPPAAAPVEAAPLAGPELAGIAVVSAPAADERLFLDAYEKAVSGEPEDARALLERYLAAFPDGRYWRRVAEILGEEP
jgi:hypothetical protein